MQVTFDELGLVADAGLVVVATLAVRLGLEALIDSTVRFTDRAGGFKPGRKVLTLVHAMVAGASHIGHADRLRSGAAARCSGTGYGPLHAWDFFAGVQFRPRPSVGRRHIRNPAPGVGAGHWAGGGRLVIDIDSTICEVYGRQAGAAYGYTKVLGYHPILAMRADTGEVLHARMRKGSANTSRGVQRFVDELIARVRRAGAAGEIVIRFDSGFWSRATIATLGRLGVRYTMAVRCANSPWPRPFPASTRPLGRGSPTPPMASPRWPRPTTAAGG